MKIFLSILIISNIFLSAYFLINGDIHFDVDVSRDFLVMDDIVRNNNFTLLGPRSGAIPGLFHGPLWFYINLPAFIIGEGNPVIVGWFWFFLSLVLLWIIFYVAKKLFDTKVAVLSVLLFSVNSIINPSIGLKNFYNPYGAVFLFPLFFYSFYLYLNNLKIKYLILSLFLLGLIIQFQMAFGIPILISLTFYLIYFLFKKKRFSHLLSYLILFLPLSTFILFEIRHNGLQTQAVLQYLSSNGGLTSVNRVNELVFNFFGLLLPGKNFLTIFLTIFSICAFIFSYKKSNKEKSIYSLFGYLFLSFWGISLFYKGSIGNYFWPFLPLTVIIFCSFVKFLKKEIFILSLFVLYIVNLYVGMSAILNFRTDIIERGQHSWTFNQMVAKKIYQDAKGDFGYFNFSPDRYAYQQRYAMIYTKKYFPNINSYSSDKKPLTYLIEVDPPEDRPELNGTSWRISDLKIEHQPDQVLRFDFIVVEKYLLTPEEIKISVNPYVLDSVFLR